MTDEEYMTLAINLAKRGEGRVAPNPLVGAVVVKNGGIIGEGWHERYGGLHAERNALNSCKENPSGGTMYVTLEPCCHYGKQPPCVEAILSAGIKRVVVGSLDVNPLVGGKGIEELKRNGVTVDFSMKRECDELNKVFFHHISTGLPYVILKCAVTLDGKIADAHGESRWITCEESRAHAHRQRNAFSSVMVGVGTVLKDDPSLTCRAENGRNPTRIICDTDLRTPLSSRIVKTACEIPTLIVTACSDGEKIKRYEDSGCGIIKVGKKEGRTDLNEAMKKLGEITDSVILEGGGELNWSALKHRIVNGAQIYIAPKILGGSSAPSAVGGEGFSIGEAARLKNATITAIGCDYLLEGEVEYVYGNN